MTQWVLHVDLDQFVAAVEVLRNPELQGLPVVVGGDGDPTKRGVVSTASYEARAHGVHSGVPLRTAARRLPEAVFLPVDAEAYEAASAEVMATLRTFDAVVEVWGWDEAYLAVETDDPEAVARQIQNRVREVTRLECTVGIGENKLQAKMAAGFGKPAGVFRLTHATWFETFGALPPDALWGIGRKTAKRLADLGITTVSDLAATDPEVLAAEIGPKNGPWLIQLGQGRYESAVTDEPWIRRSRGHETTYQQDIHDWDEVKLKVAEIARRVAEDVAADPRPIVRVFVKVRFVPFTTRIHGRKLAAPATDAAAIEAGALEVLDVFTERHRPVRLIGVSAEFAR